MLYKEQQGVGVLYRKKRRKKERGSPGSLLLLLLAGALVFGTLSPDGARSAARRLRDAALPAISRIKDSMTGPAEMAELARELARTVFGGKPKEEAAPVIEEAPVGEGQKLLSFKSYSFDEYISARSPGPYIRQGEPEEQRASRVLKSFVSSQADFPALPENCSAEYREISIGHTDPVKGEMTSGFGYRIHPVTGKTSLHSGVDIAAPEGEEVCSFADGQVEAIGENGIYGKYLLISHGEGIETFYAHLEVTSVEAGDSVKEEQPLGAVGQTGLATGPHLHFEVRCGGVYLNPLYYLSE